MRYVSRLIFFRSLPTFYADFTTSNGGRGGHSSKQGNSPLPFPPAAFACLPQTQKCGRRREKARTEDEKKFAFGPSSSFRPPSFLFFERKKVFGKFFIPGPFPPLSLLFPLFRNGERKRSIHCSSARFFLSPSLEALPMCQSYTKNVLPWCGHNRHLTFFRNPLLALKDFFKSPTWNFPHVCR